MIEINLLPEEFKLKVNKTVRDIKLRQVLYIVPLIFAILLIIHLYLAGVFMVKNVVLSALNAKWKKLSLEKKLVDDFKKEFDELSRQDRIISQLATQRVTWSQKLNKLSLDLPSGIWFNEIIINPKEFSLKASVISLEKEEMNLINILIDNLKNDNDFFKDFYNLELSSVERKVIGGYDIADFILVGKLK